MSLFQTTKILSVAQDRALNGKRCQYFPEAIEPEIIQVARNEFGLTILNVGDCPEAIVFQFENPLLTVTSRNDDFPRRCLASRLAVIVRRKYEDRHARR